MSKTRQEVPLAALLDGTESPEGVWWEYPGGTRVENAEWRRGGLRTGGFWFSAGGLAELRITAWREVEEHPHGLIPTTPGAVIRLGRGGVAALTDPGDSDSWGRVGECVWESPDTIQDLADEHGFEVLVPESAVISGPSDEMVDAGARAMYTCDREVWTWETHANPEARHEYRVLSRAALVAALGIETKEGTND